MEKIKEHGPLMCMAEDNFEKSHGLLRQNIFLQNQQAIGRDTVYNYVEEEMLYHTLSGGYMKVESEW